MHLKTPRWLLLLEAILILGGIAAVGYKLAMRIAPLPVVRVEERAGETADPETQAREYYRKYPERYIRIVDDSWLYQVASRTAVHSFTLRNIAAVGYKDIQIRFVYESRDAKPVKTAILKIPVRLAAMQSELLSGIEVQAIPSGTARVTLTVEKAVVDRD